MLFPITEHSCSVGLWHRPQNSVTVAKLANQPNTGKKNLPNLPARFLNCTEYCKYIYYTNSDSLAVLTPEHHRFIDTRQNHLIKTSAYFASGKKTPNLWILLTLQESLVLWSVVDLLLLLFIGLRLLCGCCLVVITDHKLSLMLSLVVMLLINCFAFIQK